MRMVDEEIMKMEMPKRYSRNVALLSRADLDQQAASKTLPLNLQKSMAKGKATT
jgi:hypothetical protein